MYRKVVTFLMLFLCFFCFSQNEESFKWEAFCVQNFDNDVEISEKEHRYFLVSNFIDFKACNQLKKEDKIVRVLDGDFFVINSCAKNLSQYNNINFQPANDLWKLGNFFIEDDKKVESFIIKTDRVATLENELKSLGVEISSVYRNYILAKTDYTIIKTSILPKKHVLYVAVENFTPVQESEVNDIDLSVNGIEKAKIDYANFFDIAVTIGLKDNSPFNDDLDLANKILDSDIASLEQDFHATDMATIISGNGNSGKDGLGVLESALIFPIDFNNLFPSSSHVLLNSNVYVINNSYGTSIENFYGSLAHEYDQFIYENKYILPVFSSGNAGFETSEEGFYAGIPTYSNLTGNFKMSKNSLIVGAADYANNVLPFSSKGPAFDGRIKPEMVAYSQIGTSNSTALVSAVAAIIQQNYFGAFGVLPTTDLIKGILLNAADDIENPGIDFKSGFGSLNMPESLKILENESFFQDTLISNESKTFEITIPENAINLKVMLIWNDIPANVNDNIALKNDLDITIENGNEVYFPQILDASSNIENLEKMATTGEDHINNVEQILLEDNLPQSININVKANTLFSDNQLFSVVYKWDVGNQFEWIFPIEDSNFPYNGGVNAAVKWKSSIQNQANGILQISYNEGLDWETLEENLDVSLGFFQWQIEENLHTKALFRILVEEEAFVSESFTISNGFRLSADLNCKEDFQVSWNKKENVAHYNIFTLDNNELTFLDTTVDTTYVFNKNLNTEKLFSVKPELITGEETLQSTTFNVDNFNEELCYINFAIGNFEQNKVIVDVQLSSLHNLSSLELIQIEQDNSERLINALDNLASLRVKLEDSSTGQTTGLLTYIVKATTENGMEFFSNEVKVFVFSETELFSIFPNPTTSSEGFNVQINNKEFNEATFELYAIDGKLKFSRIYNSLSFLVNLPDFAKGIYVAKIILEKGMYAQKVIIN